VEFTKEDLDRCNIRFVVPGRRSALDCQCDSIKEFKGARTPKLLEKRKLRSSESYEVLRGTRLRY
jgi:hypothetical protein